MHKPSVRATLASLLLLTAACSQDPAVVELKGQNTYSKNSTGVASGNSYASNNSPPLYSYSHSPTSAPSYTTVTGTTAQTAGIQSVGVHDLAAMAPAAGSPTFNTPMQTSSAPAQK